MSQKEKIINFLSKDSNRYITQRQAKARFGVKNLRARVCDLRDDGYYIINKVHVNSKGLKVYSYILGYPSKLW